jgi:3-deoxy-D-manno-octulosonic-acid transferase
MKALSRLPGGMRPHAPPVDGRLFAYNLALGALSPALAAYLAWRIGVQGKSREGWRERFGFHRPPLFRDQYADRHRVWVHAVSAGEVTAAVPIIAALADLDPQAAFLVSTTTTTGNQVARNSCPGADAVTYFPFEMAPSVAGALRAVRPHLCLLVEGEFWPNFLALGRASGARMMVVNGRISDRAFPRMCTLRPLYAWAFQYVDRFCMQSSLDAERVLRLGADPRRVTVAGNTKFDRAPVPLSPEEDQTLRADLSLQPDDMLLVAGSTRPGEEEAVLDAFWHLKLKHASLRLLIAPRHRERLPEVEQIIARHGFAGIRRSQLPDADRAAARPIILLDTMGELARVYGLATTAFVGGSLAPIGGHNILEPIGLGKPTWFGPHMHNARDVVEVVRRAEVGFMIRNAREMAEGMEPFLDDPEGRRQLAERCERVFAENGGAARRCAEAAVELLAEGR